MASKKVNPMLRVLTEIRDEVRGNGEALRETNARVAQTNDRVDRLAEGQVRLATEVVEVAKAIHTVRDLLRERLDDRDRLEQHEARIRSLEAKVG